MLEAMKLENEIVSPFDGTVSSVSAKDGQVVDSGALLLTIATK
nr:acetyl-CoA carboxylase biotin carboxyl carrier protein subunit [Proteiniclasticum ruminis]